MLLRLLELNIGFLSLEEMMVRKELGGYCPKDPLEFAFVSTAIALNFEKEEKVNAENRLKNLINRSK